MAYARTSGDHLDGQKPAPPLFPSSDLAASSDLYPSN